MPNSLCTLELRHTIGSLRNVVTLMSESFLAGFFREHRGVLSTRLRPLFFYKQYSDDSEVLVTLLQRQFAELLQLSRNLVFASAGFNTLCIECVG